MNDTSLRILLIEDNPGDARLLREALKELKNTALELVHAQRLSEAFSRLDEKRFDVILLDLSLPEVQGLETVVRTHEHAPSVPIVVLTGLDDEKLAVKSLRGGAQDYLVKGQVDGNLLVRAMRYAIERKGGEDQIQRHLKRITALLEIEQALTSTLELHTVLEVLQEKIGLVLPYAATTVRLWSKKSGILEPVACRNLDEEEWKAEQWQAGRGTPNIVFETKAAVVIGNVQMDPRMLDQGFFRKHGLVSYLGVPLIAKGEILGVISLYTKEAHEFSSEEVEFLTTVAGGAAIAIQNSQLYEEMRELAAELARSNKVKSEFLSVISHELRTPLNVVMGYAGMIKNRMLGEINPEQEEILQRIISRANDQVLMINSILQATQIQAEEIKAESNEIHLANFLDDLRLSYTVPLHKELALNWDYPSNLPMIKTDSRKLRQILQSLIDNAIKFSEKGEVALFARHLTETRRVEFKVVDTGVGISAESLPIIFEKFRQVDGSETRLYGGVGIGLYIVKKFTEILGGTVEVESKPEKGSTFTVTIPCEYGAQQIVIGDQTRSVQRDERRTGFYQDRS